MWFANRESISGRNNVSISRTSKYSMDLRLYLLFFNIDIDFQIKTLNSMRLHNNKDSTKVLFTSQLQTEQFPLSLLLIILIFCVYLHPVSCVQNVASVSGLSILDCSFDFL
jgi:hypothetical protein